MVQFWVNGHRIQTEDTGNLLLFLRDRLRLTSVKCGCMQGACGTCTVLVDGLARRACVCRLERLEGARILTAEGLSPREQDVYAYAFSQAGAVQCGYCLPGMLMSAKALLDRVPAPSSDQIRAALKHNLCRCTGYAGILRAVRTAADLLASGAPIPPLPPLAVGSSPERPDARDKILGRLAYAADDIPEGSLFGAVRTAGVPRARIRSIDTSAALALPGVAAVLTAGDIPGRRKVGGGRGDWPVLVGVGEEVLFSGDAVALAAASSPALARRALELVRIDWEVLPPVLSADEALRPGAPRLHPEGSLYAQTAIRRGDPEAARAATCFRVRQVYETPFAEHGFLETEAAAAIPAGDRLIVRSADQGIFLTRSLIAQALDLPPERILVEGCPVGGAFGGREDVLIQIQAALLASAAGQPVLLQYTREDSLRIHAKKHPMRMEVESGCDREGRLTFLRIDLTADKGAYASLGLPVLERACSMAPGPYRYQSVEITGRSVYTNNPPSGGYRGFGVTQTCFGVESNLNLLAEQAGLSPWEIRFRNAVVPGDALYNGQIADRSTAIREALLAVKDAYDRAPAAGIACAMKNCGSGSGLRDVGRCTLEVRHGHVWLWSAASRLGQGAEIALLQIAASVSGLEGRHFRWAAQNTDRSPDTGTATASRLTVLAGEAARRAAVQLRDRLAGLDCGPEEALAQLEGEAFCGEYEAKTEAPSASAVPVVHAAYGYAAHVAVLGPDGRVEKITAAHDVGRAIHPASAAGQIEGGVVMSFGYALTERFVPDRGLPPQNFGSIGFPTAQNAPEVEAILVERSPLEQALGAKGLGELTCIPTPAALAGAYRALDGRLRTSLPLEGTPYRKE